MDIQDIKQPPETDTVNQATNFSNHVAPESGHGFLSYVWEVVKIIIVSLAIIIPIRMFVIQPFIVEGDSMLPNFHNGEYLIVDELSYLIGGPERGDVVIFHPPQDAKTYYIKRVIGLPNETLEFKDGYIYLYNRQNPDGVRLNESEYLVKSRISETAKITLGNDEYYVIGDNRDNSLDSRRFGAITSDHIRGKAFIRAFPFKLMTIFKPPQYIFS